MLDRRRAPRGRTYLGGQIFFHRRFSSVDCLIRNLSQNGALLAFASAPILPALFEIDVAERHERLRVQMVWRTSLLAGVETLRPAADAFAATPTPAAMPRIREGDTTRYILDLIAERDKLARQISRLNGNGDA